MPTAFDGDNLIITLPQTTGGLYDLSVQVDLYEAWKNWLLLDNLNRRYPPAFSTSGGEPVTPTEDAGAYYFLRNDFGWRLRPFEEDGEWRASGNLVPADFDLPIAVPTIGPYMSIIIGLQPITQRTEVTVSDDLTPQLTVINEGVKKSSILVPHTTDLPP